MSVPTLAPADVTEPAAPTNGNGSAEAPPIPASPYINWAEFWARDRRETDWLYEPVLARGRGHAIWAGHKLGKSLLMLWIARQLIAGGHIVIYLDYEMGEDDLYDRLTDMGDGPDTDLSLLRYAQLPTLPPLDRPEGAVALFNLVDLEQASGPDTHVAVIIDTFGRATEGAENDADTVRAFYRNAGLGLKRRGVTYARLDHAGKDTAKGQRGSSGKGDDVDVVWQLTPRQGGIELKRDVARMNWVPERLEYQLATDPLRYVPVSRTYPPGTKELAELMDQLEIPLTQGERPVGKAVRDAGHKTNQAAIREAIRWRREEQSLWPET